MNSPVKEKQENKNIFLAAGGTGGHIFPALATAEELRHKGYNPIIITDKRFFNYKIDTQNLIVKKTIVSSISGNILQKLLGFIRLCLATLQALFYTLKYKPILIVGYGGYPSFPALIAATITFKKILLHEQNSVLGKVNRVFADLANSIALSFEKTKQVKEKHAYKLRYLGNPLRGEIIQTLSSCSIVEKTNPEQNEEDNITILITGGSQGAKTFGIVIPQIIEKLSPEIQKKIILIQQCQQNQLKLLSRKYNDLGVRFEVNSFFEDIHNKLKNSDIVISRAGSSTIFENAAAKVASILIPLSHSADNHQYHNAKYFSDNNAAIIIEQKDDLSENLKNSLEKLINSEGERKHLSDNIQKLAINDSAERLANLCGEVLGNR